MKYGFPPIKHPGALRGIISHYQLQLQQSGQQYAYIWRCRLHDDGNQKDTALLIDLDHLWLPGHEIDQMVFSLIRPAEGTAAVAIVNCHGGNQQEIKRKLKARDIKLYSRTAFFSDIRQAQQWLELQFTGRQVHPPPHP